MRDIDDRLDMKLTANVVSTVNEIDDKLRHLIEQLKADRDNILTNFITVRVEQQSIVDQAQSMICKLQEKQQSLCAKFDKTMEQLEKQRQALHSDQVFTDKLQQNGSNSDKVSRIPGMKKMVSNRRLLSGTKLEFEILMWKVEAAKTLPPIGLDISEKVVDMVGTESPLFPYLCNTYTATISCEKPCYTRSVNLFGEQHIVHVFSLGTRRNEMCIHKRTGEVAKVISVAKMHLCISPVVVDKAGVIVIADHKEIWTDAMRNCNSSRHIRGSLHWFTINQAYGIEEHEQIPMKCAQRGSMKVTNDGHLLVLSHCTTGKHSKQLLVYHHSDRRVPRVITLPEANLINPVSAVSSDAHTFMVADWSTNKVIWIDQRSEILQQYHEPEGGLKQPFHIYRAAKTPLLVADRHSHTIKLVSDEGNLLQNLLHAPHIRFPRSLYLDEQRGILCVVQGEAINKGIEVLTFQILPCQARIKQMCLSV